MKKGILKLSVLLASLFVGVLTTNASILTVAEQCAQIVPPSGTEYNMSCNLQLQVSADATQDPRTFINPGETFEIQFRLKSGLSSFNITNNEVKLIAATDWTIDGEASKTITLDPSGVIKVTAKYTGDTVMGPAIYKFAESQYQKDDTAAENCGFAYGTPQPDRICRMYPQTDGDGNTFKVIYGISGQLIGTDNDPSAVDQFYKECFSCKTPDESSDGKYHGLDGKETTKATYEAECTKICKIEVDKYYCSDGNECDKAQYEKECTKVCKIENDKYYCKDGNECDKTKYDEECEPNPGTGSFIPYAGIAAGILLIATSTVLVRKQTKIKRI